MKPVRLGRRPVSKYHAQPIEIDGIRFPSRREARRYQQLQVLARIGEIAQLERQVPYAIDVVNLQTGEIVTVARYFADFRYVTKDGARVIEDAKGMRTETYRLKKKLVEAQHGISILET